jgi:hypothetical protein
MIAQGFIGDLVLKNIDGESWELHEAFGYVTKKGEVIYIPKGFVTDLASIPYGFRWLFPKSGEYNKAVTVHDWLYKTQLHTRLESDDILLEAMAFEGVGFAKRYTIYWAVRAGGWYPWGTEERLIK